jgi:predicted lipid carrier protein YhbT
MTDASTKFFRKLAEGGHQPALEKVTGTVRFDLREGRKRTAGWLITIKKGDLDVSRRSSKADCVVRVDRTLFDAIASGKANAMAAVLRGAMSVDGDQGLLLALQRLFPRPPRRGS